MVGMIPRKTKTERDPGREDLNKGERYVTRMLKWKFKINKYTTVLLGIQLQGVHVRSTLVNGCIYVVCGDVSALYQSHCILTFWRQKKTPKNPFPVTIQKAC